MEEKNVAATQYNSTHVSTVGEVRGPTAIVEAVIVRVDHDTPNQAGIIIAGKISKSSGKGRRSNVRKDQGRTLRGHHHGSQEGERQNSSFHSLVDNEGIG
jgi:hypothetical protein